MHSQDLFIKGILPELSFKFLLVSICDSLNDIDHVQNLSIDSKTILGEVLAGTFLLTSSEVKQDFEMIGIQIVSDGVIKKILGYAKPTGEIRGMIIPNDLQKTDSYSDLFKNSLLQVNKFIKESQKVYSSLIDLKPISFSKNLENYIQKSNQTNSFIKILSLNNPNVKIYGYIFEPFPDTHWRQIDKLADFLSKMDPEEFLTNVFHLKNQKKNFTQKWKTKILSTGSIFFKCSCSKDKIENLILSLGRKEVIQILEEEGKVEIICEFCKKKYIYTEKDIKELFTRGY
ncbi:MAG: Hsp33 family molecular chaperone HslO [Leptonema sp. (in: bacteria)]